MADKKDKKPAATFGNIALQNYAAQRGYEVGQDASLGETLKPAVELLGNYAENAIAERAKFIDNLPEDYEVELLPVDSREAFTNFASDAKQRYSDAAGVAAKYSANPNSEQYREAVKRMEDIKKGLSTNFGDYTKLADIRKKYTNNHGNEVALTDEQEVIYTDIIAGKNFESTPNGLVYNRKDLDGNVIEQIPINDLPTIDYIDPELGNNMVTNVLDQPYAGGINGSDMQTTLSNANVQIQNLTSTPEKLKQAIFNGFGGEKTKFINYYVGENLINEADATFLNGINDIDGDGKITKDDMQEGVWSFKYGDAGNAARTLFEGTIKAHKNDPDFINNKELNVRQKLNSFMSDIAKDKYLEGQANKFKNTTYNIKGIGSRNHDQIQGDFDKLNNHEPISNYGNTATFMPVEGKPGLYYTTLADGTRQEVTRDILEKGLDIFSVRGDFNTDPVKATTTTTATATDDNTTESETTTIDATDNAEDDGQGDNVEVDGASGATIKVDPLKENVIAQNIDEIEEGIDRDNITEEQVKSARKSIGVSFGNWEKSYNKFPNTIKDADVLSKGLADIDEQLEVLLTADTKENLEKGKKKTWLGGITRSYMYDRLSKARDKYKKALDKMSGDPLDSKQPASIDSEELLQEEIPQGTKKQVEIPTISAKEVEVNLDPSIETIEAGEVQLEDTDGNVVVGSKEAVTKIVDLPELEQKKLNKIEEKEGWEFEGYIPTTGSGITVGYGIDLSQPPYNTAKGLKENGFSQEFIDMAVKEDVLGKTWSQLKADGKDVGEVSTKDGVKTTFIKNNGGTDFLRQFQIPNTEQEKIRIYNLTSKNTEKQTSLFEDVMSEDVLLDYSTIVHWGGAGLSDEKYDKLYNGGAFGADGKTGGIKDASDRKAFVITTLNRKLEKIKEEKGKISKEDYMQALEEARDFVPNFVTDSPSNAKTIDRSIASISKSKETQA